MGIVATELVDVGSSKTMRARSFRRTIDAVCQSRVAGRWPSAAAEAPVRDIAATIFARWASGHEQGHPVIDAEATPADGPKTVIAEGGQWKRRLHF